MLQEFALHKYIFSQFIELYVDTRYMINMFNFILIQNQWSAKKVLYYITQYLKQIQIKQNIKYNNKFQIYILNKYIKQHINLVNQIIQKKDNQGEQKFIEITFQTRKHILILCKIFINLHLCAYNYDIYIITQFYLVVLYLYHNTCTNNSQTNQMKLFKLISKFILSAYKLTNAKNKKRTQTNQCFQQKTNLCLSQLKPVSNNHLLFWSYQIHTRKNQYRQKKFSRLNASSQIRYQIKNQSKQFKRSEKYRTIISLNLTINFEQYQKSIDSNDQVTQIEIKL
eukprot:TRINITY_DN8221_c0_g1_i17.p1 TRINITY_DN8221_c0_g1~~TRINITY_DN8221_c0_g1_i17.p1  ORF type:complete len:282 (+),score=-25.68 TRINITY_DN8221_c0_g1_i17:522-1367(+)